VGDVDGADEGAAKTGSDPVEVCVSESSRLGAELGESDSTGAAGGVASVGVGGSSGIVVVGEFTGVLAGAAFGEEGDSTGDSGGVK
jgi:hypothetical protein